MSSARASDPAMRTGKPSRVGDREERTETASRADGSVRTRRARGVPRVLRSELEVARSVRARRSRGETRVGPRPPRCIPGLICGPLTTPASRARVEAAEPVVARIVVTTRGASRTGFARARIRLSALTGACVVRSPTGAATARGDSGVGGCAAPGSGAITGGTEVAGAVSGGAGGAGDGAGGGAAAAGGDAGAGVGCGAGAGGAAGAGGGLVGAPRGGSSESGSTYVSPSPTRMPRWTYGTGCSGSPEGPASAIISPS